MEVREQPCGGGRKFPHISLSSFPPSSPYPLGYQYVSAMVLIAPQLQSKAPRVGGCTSRLAMSLPLPPPKPQASPCLLVGKPLRHLPGVLKFHSGKVIPQSGALASSSLLFQNGDAPLSHSHLDFIKFIVLFCE